MRMFIVIFSAWIALSSSCPAAPISHEIILSPAQSLKLFSDDSRTGLLAALKSISWQEKALARKPALLFTSGQSLDAHGNRVLNRIQFFERPRYDIWLMKQAVAGRGFDFKSWNRVVIAVDRQSKPKRAFYFQFGTQPLGEKGLPKFKLFTAACLSCHSSGPRLIRPEQTHWVKPFSKSERGLFKRWNERIRNYREVKDHNPTWHGRSMVEWGDPGDHDILKISSCTECHSSGSGVRSPLMRQNEDSIWYLVRHHANAKGFMQTGVNPSVAEMPLEHHALSLKQLHCLRLWLDRDSKDLQKNGCTDNGTVPGHNEQAWLLDPFSSSLTAIASTPIGRIPISGFHLSGHARCHDVKSKGHLKSRDVCSGRLLVDLRELRTGITLRDQHLARLLMKSGARIAEMDFADFSPNGRKSSLQSRLILGARNSSLPAQISCHPGVRDGQICRVALKLSLKEMGVQPPSFLGIQVHDQVDVEGTIGFRQSDN